MSAAQEILHLLSSHLQLLKDEERASKMKSYMKGHFDYLGVDSTNRKKVVSEVWRKIQKPAKQEMFNLMKDLWDQPHREYQYIALDISFKYVKKLTPEDLDFIADLIQTKSWWDTVDLLASNLVGGAISGSKAQIPDLIVPFINSSDMWMRRSAILCQLKYKQDVNAAVLADCILKTIRENEFFIRKAHGWALRQYSKFNPEWVSSFITDNQSKLSNLAVREGSKYLI